MILEQRVACTCFALGTGVVLVPMLTHFHLRELSDLSPYGAALYTAVVNGVLLFMCRGYLYQVGIRACGLGLAFGLGLWLSVAAAQWYMFGWYMCALSFFHFSEYIVTATYNPESLSLDSFLLNHSMEYGLAAIASWVEFGLEAWIFPDLKQVPFLHYAGLFLVVGGEFLRKAAMLTAKSNFNHIVQSKKADSHMLVTHGVYQLCRHPAYVGWFYWSLGTQVLLCNPVCVVGYTWASWHFFRERVEDEEVTLLNFFGEQYLDYMQRVGTGLPFIQGFKANF
ncbi:protein-S-isoprenylcysteine O-methyltransferase-like isoform X1 [Branchiostoma floridae]|uniref:Protein-S-isoprenylcysteine O-methyltransferase n=1 Tax=Branchiostoma floridae TaxID=7739 RepID=C3ZIC0_BRAFL|nr:protein-S-isoprenylcysteine O-methyltransferase-like isoform X1 [Branchiostoma floridae]|eukprot:XP_002591634.1 hypothetical protein BRAFLDRAFT_265706 [Branchiostoma floridae]